MTNENDEKLADLQARVASLKADVAPPAAPEKSDSELGKAYELIATPLVCGAIGAGLDHVFSTSPAFFITLAFLGVCAAFWSIYKSSQDIVTPLDSKRLRGGKKTAMKAAISEKDSQN
jgi:F0F1-type ATP synthase assembly protein I